MILEIFLYFQLYLLYVFLHNFTCALLLQTMDINEFDRIIGYRMILFILIGFPIFLYDLYVGISNKIKKKIKIRRLRKELEELDDKINQYSHLGENSVIVFNYRMKKSQIKRQITGLISRERNR